MGGKTRFGKAVTWNKSIFCAGAAVLLFIGYGYDGKSGGNDDQQKQAVVKDSRDGKKYKTVKIGEQKWMAENLNYEENNSICYGNNKKYCAKYGRLYTWDAAMSACPAGWHLPSSAEWTTLTDYAGGSSLAGKKLKSTAGWYTERENGKSNGSDNYGFSASPGGYSLNEKSSNVGYYGYWWNSTEYNAGNASSRSMDHYHVNVFKATRDKAYLFSVRCVQD
jgi:uncharacterized protein (TIGR02145 family)